MPQPWPEDRIELVRLLAGRGLTAKQIGGHLGLSHKSVSAAAWRKEIPIAKEMTPWSDLMKQTLVQMANDGAEVGAIVAEISELAGKPISPKVVRQRAYMRNVDFRPADRRWGLKISRQTWRYLVAEADARGCSGPKELIGALLLIIARDDLAREIFDETWIPPSV